MSDQLTIEFDLSEEQIPHPLLHFIFVKFDDKITNEEVIALMASPLVAKLTELLNTDSEILTED